jgi:hypothetical protein
MSSTAFARRQRAAEGQWFGAEDRLAIIRRLERLVEQGKIESSALDAVRRLESPTEVVSQRPVQVFDYQPGLVPPPRPLQRFGLGTQFSLGRARWATADDASVFSVSDGKRLAGTPHKSATNYENIRMAKIQRAALEGPTLAGYRVLPEFTPGRALMWGTILAMWGTAAAVSLTARQLDIENAADAPTKLRAAFAPVVEAFKARLAPLRDGISKHGDTADGMRQEAISSAVVQRLKGKLMRAAD